MRLNIQQLPSILEAGERRGSRRVRGVAQVVGTGRLETLRQTMCAGVDINEGCVGIKTSRPVSKPEQSRLFNDR